ncbi:hypothetical protein [Microbacterium jiangjiandongii]|uniref:hypothetical protein n=1 Tax=Microbacterium jiangjiandongii TaxID=3049071 RepID=UPI00214AA5AD|nr:hypothetical protein [Microbacterium sp. zg.Y843]MCR2817157.1 hypothetical protein [Microbacterium sp. zg.Y843]
MRTARRAAIALDRDGRGVDTLTSVGRMEDAATTSPAPAPYPAACRPQACSAAAAIVCLQIATAP